MSRLRYDHTSKPAKKAAAVSNDCRIVSRQAADVKIGDTLITLDDQRVRVTEIVKGVPRNHLEFKWCGGWATAAKNDTLQVEASA